MTKQQQIIIAVLALAVLCVFSTICLMIAALPSRTSNEVPVAYVETPVIPSPRATTMPTNTPLPTPTPAVKKYRIGDTITSGNWSYTVTNADREGVLDWSKYGVPVQAKGRFIIVYMTLTNIGKENFTIRDWDFELQDDKGIRYNTSDDWHISSFIEYKNLTRLGDQFIPGLSTNTAVVFDVNPNATGLRLYLIQAREYVDLNQ